MDGAKRAQQLIDNNAVFLFTKSWCSYCRQSKQTLAALGADVKFLDLDHDPQGPAIQAALEEMTGQHTVPNIFINKRHIGGNSDLQRRRSELSKLLKDAGALKGQQRQQGGSSRRAPGL